MATYLITHEVDDVNHWLASTRREEFFGPHGITARPFRDPAGSNRVGLLAEIGDLRLQNSRNLGGANIHGYALFRANLRESSFDFSEAS